jgi:predicted AAA+ superfamily ATPase
LKYTRPISVSDQLNYYQRKTGAEIDFVIPDRGEAYEVKATATVFDVNNLNKTAKRLNITNAKVVSLNLPITHPQIIFPYEL